MEHPFLDNLSELFIYSKKEEKNIPLSFKYNLFMDEIKPKVSGILPVNSFENNTNVFNADNVELNDNGIIPVNKLLLKLISESFCKFPNEFGIVPVKKLVPKSK